MFYNFLILFYFVFIASSITCPTSSSVYSPQTWQLIQWTEPTVPYSPNCSIATEIVYNDEANHIGYSNYSSYFRTNTLTNITYLFIDCNNIIESCSFTIEVRSSINSSVILLIADGMGMEIAKYFSLIEHNTDDLFSTLLYDFKFYSNISSNNIYDSLTDSAASATAISTGTKTANGRIATTADGITPLRTILEIAKNNSYKTGLVASCHLTHATPASFAAHESSRNNYLNIAQDYANSGVDLLLGGGSSSSYLGNYINQFVDKGYHYITTVDQLNELTNHTSLPLLGLFSSTNLVRMEDWTPASTQPKLSQMAMKAIELLNSTGGPFFLMIESSQIDWAAHANDKMYLTHEMAEFENTLSQVKALKENDKDIQILLTADHDTGGLNILSYNFTYDQPFPEDSYEIKKSKRDNRTNEILVDFSTTGHTTRPVLLAGIGPYTDMIDNANHHIDTFEIMNSIISPKVSEPNLIFNFSDGIYVYGQGINILDGGIRIKSGGINVVDGFFLNTNNCFEIDNLNVTQYGVTIEQNGIIINNGALIQNNSAGIHLQLGSVYMHSGSLLINNWNSDSYIDGKIVLNHSFTLLNGLNIKGDLSIGGNLSSTSGIINGVNFSNFFSDVGLSSSLFLDFETKLNSTSNQLIIADNILSSKINQTQAINIVNTKINSEIIPTLSNYSERLNFLENLTTSGSIDAEIQSQSLNLNFSLSIVNTTILNAIQNVINDTILAIHSDCLKNSSSSSNCPIEKVNTDPGKDYYSNAVISLIFFSVVIGAILLVVICLLRVKILSEGWKGRFQFFDV